LQNVTTNVLCKCTGDKVPRMCYTCVLVITKLISSRHTESDAAQLCALSM